MRYIFTTFLFTTFLLSCEQKQEDPVTYFGGEILNPNDRYVVLFKNDDPVDTAALDHNNRFLLSLKQTEEGLYHFEHLPEFQYVFIEEGDSILIRLNTYDFDESLVFSGRGAAKNNFLVEMFLMNEDEEHLIYKYYEMEPEGFKRKMDSLYAMKLEEYDNLIANYELSEDAKNITKAAIDYTHYAHMEIYPYRHKIRNQLNEVPELPDGFYAYRKTLNANDDRLSYFRPYFTYMVAKISNLSYVHHLNKREKDSIPIEKSFQYHDYKLDLIDSLVTDPRLKDNLYRNVAYFYLLGRHPEAQNEIFLEKFNRLSGNEKHKESTHKLYTSINALKADHPLPEVFLKDTNGHTIALNTHFSATHNIFYFWTMDQGQDIRTLSKRVKELEQRHPSYRFIGINIDDNPKIWLKYINDYCLNVNNQFRVENYKDLREKLVINDLNKIIITRKNGIITDAFAYIYNEALEDSLYSYAKKNKHQSSAPSTK